MSVFTESIVEDPPRFEALLSKLISRDLRVEQVSG